MDPMPFRLQTSQSFEMNSYLYLIRFLVKPQLDFGGRRFQWLSWFGWFCSSSYMYKILVCQNAVTKLLSPNSSLAVNLLQ